MQFLKLKQQNFPQQETQYLWSLQAWKERRPTAALKDGYKKHLMERTQMARQADSGPRHSLEEVGPEPRKHTKPNTTQNLNFFQQGKTEAGKKPWFWSCWRPQTNKQTKNPQRSPSVDVYRTTTYHWRYGEIKIPSLFTPKSPKDQGPSLPEDSGWNLAGRSQSNRKHHKGIVSSFSANCNVWSQPASSLLCSLGKSKTSDSMGLQIEMVSMDVWAWAFLCKSRMRAK